MQFCIKPPFPDIQKKKKKKKSMTRIDKQEGHDGPGSLT